MNLVKLQDTKLMHRNQMHFYILNNEKSEREIRETFPFIITSKRIKYLETNLLKKKTCSLKTKDADEKN